MKKNLSLWSVVALSLLIAAPVSAQMFQNGNTDCQQITVLDINGDTNSVACQNINGGADFNGDTYPDCALLTSATTDVATAEVFSVLMNLAAGSSSCSTQFDTADNYAATGLDGGSPGSPLGSIVAGPILSSSVFDDAAAPNLDPALVLGDTAYATLPSVAAGGFGATSPIPITSSNASFDFAGGPDIAFANDVTDKNAALIDCNNDGFLDAALMVKDDTGGDTFRVNFLLNNGGAGLQNASVTADTGIAASATEPLDIGALAVGDFNNDNNDDVVVTVSPTSGVFGGSSIVQVCTNDGSCAFTCQASTQVNLNSLHAGSDPTPTSIVAGDFNGDGNYDVAVTTPGLATATEGVDFLFGNGATVPAFPTNLVVEYIGGTTGNPVTLTTGCYDNDNTTDVAMTYGSGAFGNVGVFTNINSTDVNTDVLNFTNSDANSPTGIDSADFDRLGGDDILIVATDGGGERQALVFLNTVETIVATAGSDVSLSGPGSVVLTGTCAIDPEDEAAVFAPTWSILEVEEEGANLTGSTTLTPTFTATESGTYTIQLSCRTRCDDTGTDTLTITVGGVPTGVVTQGGCVGNTLSPSAPNMLGTIYGLMTLAPVAIYALRRRRSMKKTHGKSSKKLIIAALCLVGLAASPSVHALSQSFSTEFFKPAVDDSDYLSVYSSQNLKKGNYHFGLWLDYAKDPYELGTTNYNRVSGITNSLLTGNFLGSYAVMDWFSVGGRLPVYFVNNIDATILGRVSETRLDLGDFELDLKFKLLDRETKHVGLSIIPFVSFPTATRATSDFSGNGNFTGGALIAVDGKVQERVSLALNTGFQGRGTYYDITGNKIASKFLISGAVAVDIIKKQLKVIGETQVETVVSDFFSNRRTTPAEARLGIRYRFKNGINVNAAGGMGYTNGISAPEFRAIAGVTYTSGRMNEFTLKEPAPDTFELKDEDVWAKAGVGDELKLRDKIYFDYDKASIRPISKPTLDKLALFLKNHPEFTKLRIEGNTCDLGSERYNMGLSKRRAMSVDQYLVSQGVSASRLEVVGNGKLKPLVPNSDEAHREQNRRVQIFVAAKQ